MKHYGFYWGLICSVLIAGFSQAEGLPDFTDLIEKHSPAVVKITALSRSAPRLPAHGAPGMPQQIPEAFRELLEQRQMPRGQGAGFIIGADGYILTNKHLVDSATEIKVVLVDQREFEAKLVGSDERSDLALLKIDANSLPTLSLAKSDSLKVGQWVVAIGSPYGLDYSASVGIVSAIGRDIPSAHSENTYVPFIQTDVAINPDNSGGPLFNLQGEVVGINSQIFSPMGRSMGLSFAIPSSLALDVVSQLKDKGRVDRGWLGVYLQEVDKGLANSMGLDKPQGALVNDVTESGPADRAGIQAGDVIVKYQDQTINHSSDLPHLVGRTRPDTKVSMTVIRKGKEQVVQVVVGSLPGSPNEVQAQSSPAKNSAKDPLGLELATYSNTERNGPDAGVLVQSVKPGSPSATAGLRQGDVITQLAFSEINSIEVYQKVVKGLKKNESYAVRFYRDGRAVFRSLIIND